MNRNQLAALISSLFLIGSAEVVTGPMMKVMGPHFGVPSSYIAYLPAAYGLTYGIAAIFTGPFSDRFGRKRLLQFGLSGYAIFCALIPNVPNLAAAVAVSALIGVCAAVIQPNALSLVGDEAPPEQVGQFIGRVFIGLMLAFVLTPILVGRLADMAGWQSAYYGLSAMAIVVLLAVSAVFPHHPENKDHAVSAWATHRGALTIKGIIKPLSASYLWLGWVAGFGAVVPEICVRKLALSSTSTGILAGFYGMAIISGNLFSVQMHRLLGNAALPSIALVSAAGIAAFLLPVDSLLQLSIAGIPWAFFYGCAGPLHHTQLNNLSDQYRGTINSYHASLLNLGIFSVSFLMGTLVSTVSWEAFCLLVSLTAVMGATLLIR